MAFSARFDGMKCDTSRLVPVLRGRDNGLLARPGLSRLSSGHWLFRVAAVVLLTVSLALSVSFAAAQETSETAIALPDPLTPDAINALVSRLSDTEVRNLLLQELGARQTAAKPVPERTPSIVESLTFVTSAVADRLVEAVRSAPQNAQATFSAIRQYLEDLGTAGTIRLGLTILAAFLAGFLIDVLYWRFLLSSPSSRDAPFEMPEFPASVPYLARRLVREAGGALLALIAAVAVLALTLPPREAGVGMTVVLWVWFLPRLVYIALKFLLSPERPDLRVVVTDDRTARILMVNLVGLTVVVGLMGTIVRVVDEVGATDSTMHAFFWAKTLVFAWLAGLFVVCRSGLQSIVRGRGTDPTGWQNWIVRAYPTVALVAIFLAWLAGTTSGLFGNVDLARNGRHLISLGLVLLAPMFDTAIRASVRILAPPMRGTGRIAVKAHEAATRSYVRVARVILFGGILVILAWIWGVSLFSTAGDEGRLFSGAYLEGLLIVLFGFVALELSSVFFNRKLANEVVVETTDDPEKMDDGPAAGAAASRLGTILPPLSWALQAAIIVLTLLTALGHIGLNVTALLAGAGVIGIAVGFGAQKLVADVVSGLFFLIDDAFRLNEYINAGGMEGTVEKIAIRSLLLRKSDGALHCVPYSGVDAVTNFGRDWGTMKQVFTVPFDTNIEKVRKIFKKIGTELSEIPEYKDAFIQPFKYKGVSQVNDVGIVVRGKFMYKPEKSMQFLIQREIYKRVQTEFAAAGIQFARREVHVSVDRNGSEQDRVSDKVAAAAASEAVAASLAGTAKTA